MHENILNTRGYMKKITAVQKQILQTAQEQYRHASEKLDIIVQLIADAHNISIPFRIDDKTDELISQDTINNTTHLDNKIEQK